MSAVDGASGAKPKASETVAGFLAALSIFVALIGIAWHPLRLIGPAIVVSLVAAAMGGRGQRLPFAAVLIVAASFFFGMLFAVITSNPLW